MIYFNLTQQQKAALREVLNRFKERPTSAEYDQVHRNLKWLNKPSRRPTKFPKARSNWHTNAFGDKWPVLLDADFTHADVPEGFAVYSIFDSAGTHAVDYAAVVVWRELWNHWDSQAPDCTIAGAFTRDIKEALE